jgi:ATP-dependent Clp protease ATP-binding subunit ClpA
MFEMNMPQVKQMLRNMGVSAADTDAAVRRAVEFMRNAPPDETFQNPAALAALVPPEARRQFMDMLKSAGVPFDDEALAEMEEENESRQSAPPGQMPKIRLSGNNKPAAPDPKPPAPPAEEDAAPPEEEADAEDGLEDAQADRKPRFPFDPRELVRRIFGKDPPEGTIIMSSISIPMEVEVEGGEDMSDEEFREALHKEVEKELPEWMKNDDDDNLPEEWRSDFDVPPWLRDDGFDMPDLPPRNVRTRQKGGSRKRKNLNQFSVDLTEKARKGQLDRIIGRDDEIFRTMQILCRRTKNNPCLIGEPGVGKTAIAEGLAMKIAAGEVPMRLADKEIHALDLPAMVAGTQYRGQFEARIKGVLEEVRALGNIILFIDEVHSLVSAGDAEGAMNAANILKPALSRGEVQVIGATTFNEYRKYIEKDSALERRMQPVKVEEPSIDDTCRMLEGIKGYYEDYHKVKISDGLIRKAVVLSERYIADRFLPDKAIDLLDEACTGAALRSKAIEDYERLAKRTSELAARLQALDNKTGPLPPDFHEKRAKLLEQMSKAEAASAELEPLAKSVSVTEDDLANVVQLWTGIPATKVMQNEIARLKGIDAKLNAAVIGQEEAVAGLCAAIRRSRVQLQARLRPASFIFVGPTGVGKTELAKRLTAELFDKPDALIRMDMSEFMEKHAVSRVIGSPPGYVGYDEAGQLTEKVRRRPYSVILFDEIEKAHPDVMHILLQILDEGKIQDAQGRSVSFANTVIIMTSNAGSELKGTTPGFGKTQNQNARDKAMDALKKFLRPEFLGRVDEVVCFRALEQADYKRIAALKLSELAQSVAEKNSALTWDEAVEDYLAAKAVKAQSGAREVLNVLRREAEDKITTAAVENGGSPPPQLHLSAAEDALTLDA